METNPICFNCKNRIVQKYENDYEIIVCAYRFRMYTIECHSFKKDKKYYLTECSKFEKIEEK